MTALALAGDLAKSLVMTPIALTVIAITDVGKAALRRLPRTFGQGPRRPDEVV